MVLYKLVIIANLTIIIDKLIIINLVRLQFVLLPLDPIWRCLLYDPPQNVATAMLLRAIVQQA